MIFDILTLFPEMFRSPLEESIIGKACKAGLIQVNLFNIRDYAEGKHRVTDDYPYAVGKGNDHETGAHHKRDRGDTLG